RLVGERAVLREPLRHLDFHAERANAEYILVAERGALDLSTIQQHAVDAIEIDEIVALWRADDDGMVPAQVRARQANVVVLAATDQRALSQSDARDDLTAAADDDVALRRRIGPLLGAARLLRLELRALPVHERGYGLAHDARVGAIQSQLTQKQQRHLTQNVRGRITPAAQPRDH